MVRKWENTAQELMFEQKWKNSTPFFIDYLKGSIYEVPIKKRLVVMFNISCMVVSTSMILFLWFFSVHCFYPIFMTNRLVSYVLQNLSAIYADMIC